MATVIRPTLQSVLDTLSSLAKTEQAEQYSSSIALLQDGGAIVTIHYTGSHQGDLPREAHLFFGGGEAGLLWAFVFDPGSFFNAIEEGLEMDKAEVQARRIVETVGDVVEYLCGRAYRTVAATS